MKRIFILLLLTILTIQIYAENGEEVYGTYLGGQEKVTKKEIELYRKAFVPRETELSEYVYLLEPSEGMDRDIFAKLVAEVGMAKDVMMYLTPTSVTAMKQQEKVIRDLFLEEQLEQKLREEAANISMEEIQEYYRENEDNYRTPDRIKIRIIYKDFGKEATDKEKQETREEIQDILEKVRENPESFGKIAKEESDSSTARHEGMVGWLTRQNPSLNPKFFDRALPLREGEISDIMGLPTGFVIVLMEEKEESRLPPLEEVQNQIQSLLKYKKYEQLKEEWSKPEKKEELLKQLREDPDVKRQIEFLITGFKARPYVEEKLDVLKNTEKDYRRFHRQKRKLLEVPKEWEVAGIKIEPEIDNKQTIKERRNAIMKAEEEAKVILSKLESGGDFSDLAREYSVAPGASEGGYYGWVNEQAQPAVAKVIESKRVGEFGGPVGYDYGWWIFKILRIKEAKQLSFAETRETVEKWYEKASRDRMKIAFYKGKYLSMNPKINESESNQIQVEQVN